MSGHLLLDFFEVRQFGPTDLRMLNLRSQGVVVVSVFGVGAPVLWRLRKLNERVLSSVQRNNKSF